jgi:hypothetical protein
VLDVVIQTMEAISKQALENTLPPPFWDTPKVSIHTA